MKPALVVGGSGQVGYHLMRTFKNANLPVIGTHLKNPQHDLIALDIVKEEAVKKLLTDIRPPVVYVPASLTNVEYCETHPEVGYEVNVVGIANLVRWTNQINAKIVYFSSDYIFDGKSGPYTEQDPANPICVYGQQKLLAEHLVATHSQSFLIIRTTVVYGWEPQGKNFIIRLQNTLAKNQTLRVPIDQVGSPTYAPDLAQATLQLANTDHQGVFNIVGPQQANRYEFALEAARAFALDPDLIQPVTTAEFNQIAPRPLNAGMTTTKTEVALGRPLVAYQDGLRQMAHIQKDFLTGHQ
ncbi:SDR family oxidoreductase [Chloroflexota bacterium]